MLISEYMEKLKESKKAMRLMTMVNEVKTITKYCRIYQFFPSQET
jgi:hypothetical protein